MDSNTTTAEAIPQALDAYCNMEIVNSRITIYSGRFTLTHNNKAVDVVGEVFYSLYSDIHLEYQGVSNDSAIMPLGSNTSVDINTPEGLKGECIVSQISIQSGSIVYYGPIQYLKAENKECNRWHWSYINMIKFNGSGVQRTINNVHSVSADRLTFRCKDGTSIVLENVFDNTPDPIQNRISHRCELVPAVGKDIDFESAQKYIVVFSQFISFVVGRSHSPIWIAGEGLDGHQYAYHYAGYDKSRVGVFSWCPFPYDKGVESLWPEFESIWNGKDADRADILSTAIHWYLEANICSGKMEGAFIMAIAGVEMMWNVILKKQKGEAKDKLQTLLKIMNYIPSFDEAELIQTRNTLVHYDRKKRKKYRKLTVEQKMDSLESALNVLELVILYWLGYQGYYADRITGNKWQGASTKLVPWVNKSKGARCDNKKLGGHFNPNSFFNAISRALRSFIFCR